MTDKTLLAAISNDRALGSSVLFSHRHSHATPPMHVAIMDLWASPDEFVLIEAFRHGAKTTLAEEFLLQEACYGNFFYCLLIGETYAKACQTLESIAYEAIHNVKLAALFGKVLSRKPIENKCWFASGALIEAVGWEQEFRGFKFHNRRPDRAYLDDIENLERVRDKDAVDATMNKIYRQLRPAMDVTRRRIRWTQTPLAPDCGVTRTRNSPGWLCAQFPICNGDPLDPKTESNWPELFPMTWVRAERQAFESNGKLRDFNQEYMLVADSEEAKPFREDMLRFTDIAPQAWLPRYAIYDPSRTASAERSDRTGKVVVSRLGTRIIVHASGGYFWKPDEIRKDIFETQEHHKLAGVAVEKNSLDEFLLQPIRFEMLRRGVVLNLMPLQAPQDRDKNAFIMGLYPFFKSGEVYLVGGRTAHAQLVAEFLNFPSGNLDTLNALAYALKVFSGDIVYEDFGEDNIAPAQEPGMGDTVYLCWNASPAEVACVAMTRNGRHYTVARDWAAPGAMRDAVTLIAAEVRATFPRSRLENWCAAELHESFSRIALVPALRESRLTPYRADSIVASRGSLADLMRTGMRGRRLLACDRRAKLTINALAGGYRFKVGAGGRRDPEPEPGTARLVAEALEATISMMLKGAGEGDSMGENIGYNPQGAKYHTALPGARK